MGHLGRLGARPGARAVRSPLPFFTGEEGPKRSLGGEGLYTRLGKTLTSHRFAVGPSSPAESGRGEDRRRGEGRRR
jgi:hypothetical protein